MTLWVSDKTETLNGLAPQVRHEDSPVEARQSEETSHCRDRVIIEIEATRGWRSIDLRDLWAYRELLYVLVWRDLKVRYRQTLLGAVWVMGQPLLSMLIFTFIFNRLAKIDWGAGQPYAVLVLAGLLPWNFFAAGLQNSGNSLVGSSYLISKVYFPRLLVPASVVIAGLVDFLVSCLLLLGLMAWYEIVPGIGVLVLPFVILQMVCLTLGIGIWLSALNVEYRDVRVLIPFLLQIGMFLTPVVYPLRLLPSGLRPLVLLNPMTGIVEGIRASLLGGDFPWLAFVYSTFFALLFLVSGTYLFRRSEREFIDVL